MKIQIGAGLGSLIVAAVLLVARLGWHVFRRDGRSLLIVLGIGIVEALVIGGALAALTLPHVLYCWRFDLGGEPLPPRLLGCAH
jgi:hypothetical protein